MEYALVIGALVAALVAMQAYVKRGMQGRLRDTADSLGQQYESKNTITNSPSVMTFKSTSTIITEILSEKELSKKYGKTIDLDGDGKIEDDVFGTVTTNVLGDSTITQKGSETVGKL